MAGHVADHPILPGNVARILDLRLQPLGQHGGDLLSPADDAREERIGDLWAAQQLFGDAALRCRGQTCRFHRGPQVSGAQMRLVQTAALCVQNGLRVLILGPAVILHQPIVPADGGQALVGVVLPQGQPVFAAAGHHAVRVHDTLGHKVIHQRTEVARMTRQNELFFAQCIAGGVQAGQQPLRSRFLVAGGAIELPRTVQTANVLALQRCFQTGGVHTVVFDGVGRTHDLDVLKPFDAPVEGILHIFRQAAGSTL